MLLKSRCDAQATNSEGQTAMFIAAAAGLVDVIDVLVSEGAAVNHPDSTGRTPLFKAIEGDSLDVARLLVSNHDASASVKDNKGKTLIDVLSRGPKSARRNQMRRLIEEKVQREQASYEHQKRMVDGLFTAARSESLEQLESRIQSGVDPKLYQDAGGESALHFAAKHEDGDGVAMQMCRNLIDNHGLHVNFPDRQHKTALYKAVQKGHSKTAELLIQRKANCDHLEINGQNALFYAAAG